MNVLILKSDKTEFERYYIDHMNVGGCVTKPYYKKITREGFFHYISVLWMQKLRIPFSSIWYGDWKNEIKQADVVILFDRVWGEGIIEYIKKKNPTCRIIFWYWNSLLENQILKKKYRKFCECWTFDPYDAKRFNMKLNVSFHFPQTEFTCENVYDAIFIGVDKGRTEVVNSIAQILKSYDKKFRFIVVGSDDKEEKFPEIEFYKHEMGYYDYLKLLKTSACIVEVIQRGQEGVTARAIESIMFKKKLITTNKFVKKMEFYNSQNIFVWGEDDVKELSGFLDTPYVDLEKKIEESYSFLKWIENFGIDKI